MAPTVTLPLSVVVWAIAALVVSLLAHITSLSLSLSEVVLPTNSLAKDSLEFPIPVNQVAFTTVKSERFGLYSNDSDWDSILPHGAGFMIHPKNGQHYLLAHYHQLHCLSSLRKYLRMAMIQNVTQFTPMDVGHVSHCMIYLRQLTLCNVDLTLEPPSHKQTTPDGRVVNTVTGVGITHRCRDWSQVWHYMEDNFSKYKNFYGDM
ncbi:hypothetical protein CPB83DRAFT_861709 [Crepidotus variabilis]|uniref:Uncharacterized protein n=1 Tax=Crepidotus variabilis TaxID=179855 RepID=A0A9P6E858_9AGAR|nr:hypothetical protein CPB83DRAFT_861709 [Crepidotus variabilis]